MIALGIALLFLAYELGKLEKQLSQEAEPSPEPVKDVPENAAGEDTGGMVTEETAGKTEETEEEEIRASAPESPQES